MVAGGLGLEGVENLAGFLIQALVNHIGEEERFCNINGVLDQRFRVLLVQEGVQHPQIRQILLLSILGVR